jgi:hypothetical protein
MTKVTLRVVAMGNRTSPTHLALALLFLMPLFLPFAPAGAQVLPSATMDCTPTTLNIQVAPGNVKVGTFICTVENDSLYVEEVSIEVAPDLGLTIAAPGKVTVGAQDETTFEIVVRGTNGMSRGTRNVNITYQVTSVSGTPCFTCAEEELQLYVDIASYGWPRFEMDGQELLLGYSSAGTVNFTVKNTGNDVDTLLIRIENQSGLEAFGVIMQLSDNSVQLEVNESKDISISLTTTEEVGDGRFEVKIWVASKRAKDDGDPVEFADVFALQTEAKLVIISIDDIPTWAVAVGVGLLLLVGVGVCVVVVKLVSSRRAEVFDEDFDLDDDFEDDFDDLDLDEF